MHGVEIDLGVCVGEPGMVSWDRGNHQRGSPAIDSLALIM